MCSAESVWKAKVLIKKASAHLIVNNTEALLNEIYIYAFSVKDQKQSVL